MASEASQDVDELMNDKEIDEQAPNENDYDSDDGQGIFRGNDPLLVVLPGATKNAASFQIEREDHTLGNSLRYFISKNPDVEFCGYTIPHPSETKMHIRIQTWDDCDTTAFDALRKGLQDMIAACGVVTEKFTAARDEFQRSKGPAATTS